jgi:hypothetical protein
VETTDGPLIGVIVITPETGAGRWPVIDGHPIPVITPNQRGRLPGAWLARRTEGEAA